MARDVALARRHGVAVSEVLEARLDDDSRAADLHISNAATL